LPPPAFAPGTSVIHPTPKGTGACTASGIDQMSLSNTNLSSSFVPSISRRERGMVGRLVSAILSQWPERTRGSPPLPNYLRRDVGLDPIEPSRRYWDHQ